MVPEAPLLFAFLVGGLFYLYWNTDRVHSWWDTNRWTFNLGADRTDGVIMGKRNSAGVFEEESGKSCYGGKQGKPETRLEFIVPNNSFFVESGVHWKHDKAKESFFCSAKSSGAGN